MIKGEFMQLDVLKNIGLTDGEVKVYQTLLEGGELSAGELIRKTALKRGDCYNKIYNLRKKGLIREISKQGKKTFRLEHPDKIVQLMEDKINDGLTDKKTLESIMPNLISQYNLVRDKPGVTFYEGKDGIQTIYNDILREMSNEESYQLIRSKYEEIYNREIVPKILQPFVKKRVRKKIRVNSLTPYEPPLEKENPQERIKKDQKNLFDRQWVLTDDYNAPVEIDIYKNKVAFLSFKKELLGAVIESPQIALAMKQLFLLAKLGAKIRFEDKYKK